MSGLAKKQAATRPTGIAAAAHLWDRNAHPIDSHDKEARQP
jgi:hypothetical protein